MEATTKHLASLILDTVYGGNIPLEPLLNQRGNLKIPASTAIFNMSSATHCPSQARGLCHVESVGVPCYALAAEKFYKAVLPFRMRQTRFWKTITAKDFVGQFLLIQSKKRNPFTALRFNEAGDFHTQQCVNKAEQIARELKKHGVTVYCYTSAKDFDFSKVRALRIAGSGFKKEGVVNTFLTIKDLKDRPRGYSVCPQDCRICSKCQGAGHKIVVTAHGYGKSGKAKSVIPILPPLETKVA